MNEFNRDHDWIIEQYEAEIEELHNKIWKLEEENAELKGGKPLCGTKTVVKRKKKT